MVILRCINCYWGYTVTPDAAKETAKSHLCNCTGPIIGYGKFRERLYSLFERGYANGGGCQTVNLETFEIK